MIYVYKITFIVSAMASAASVIREVAGDLFSVPNTASLVHCVAEDLRMSQGIAVEFRQRFGRIPELLNQRCITGQMAFLSDPRDDPKRFIFYLVTKAKSTGKPTLESLESSLHCLKDHCMRQNVTQLSMPRIGCGLDLLKWSQVSEMLHRIFMNSGISITIYNLDLVTKALIIYL
jgi:O-acetyl-ADP-ribose deacetylase (regulator of RNase III)